MVSPGIRPFNEMEGCRSEGEGDGSGLSSSLQVIKAIDPQLPLYASMIRSLIFETTALVCINTLPVAGTVVLNQISVLPDKGEQAGAPNPGEVVPLVKLPLTGLVQKPVPTGTLMALLHSSFNG